MVGDIDFIVSKEDYSLAIEIFKKNGYSNYKNFKNPFPHTRHYARIIKDNKIAAVEIHDELTTKKYFKVFGYKQIMKNSYTNSNNMTFISYQNQICLSIISKHINDNGYLFFDISLKSIYDVFLLSRKTNTQNAIKPYKKIEKRLQEFLAVTFIILGKPKSIITLNKKYINIYIHKYMSNLNEKNKLRTTLLKKYLKWKLRLSIFKSTIFNKKMRMWLIELIKTKEWQEKKLKIFSLNIRK